MYFCCLQFLTKYCIRIHCDYPKHVRKRTETQWTGNRMEEEEEDKNRKEHKQKSSSN